MICDRVLHSVFIQRFYPLVLSMGLAKRVGLETSDSDSISFFLGLFASSLIKLLTVGWIWLTLLPWDLIPIVFYLI